MSTKSSRREPPDYPWVRAWEQMMGAAPWYIDRQIATARSEGAPQTATYRHESGAWSTIDDIISVETRQRLGLPITGYAVLMTAHQHASAALQSLDLSLGGIRTAEVPATLAIERSRAIHDLDRAARALVSAKGRVRDLAEKTRAEGC